MLRCLLADPQTLVRAGLRGLIEATGLARVIAEAGDGQALLVGVAQHRPQAVLLEWRMAPMSGLEALVQLRRHYPEVRALVMSASAEVAVVQAALKAGASGFLSKLAEPDELRPALRALGSGHSYLSPAVAHAALDRRRSPLSEDHVVLTPRQRQVLQLIARGRSTKEIAALIGVSVKTVETHRLRLMQALGLRGTQALMRHALRAGYDVLEGI
ncbi:MAG TPA: response regulator transcription factor [Nevskiaceae bacterium]|nr:response regulator transcription factor [Nevskiaceae bacterium]